MTDYTYRRLFVPMRARAIVIAITTSMTLLLFQRETHSRGGGGARGNNAPRGSVDVDKTVQPVTR